MFNNCSYTEWCTVSAICLWHTLSDQDGKRRFEYNLANRLVRFYRKDRLRASYAYNAFGQRISKTLHHREDKHHDDHEAYGKHDKRPHQTTVYHYDLNGQLIAETKPEGDLIKAYVWVDATPLVQITGHANKGIGHANGKHKRDDKKGHREYGHKHVKEIIHYLHTDHLGTPRIATNAEGEQVWYWMGNAFGDTQPEWLDRHDERHEGKRKHNTRDDHEHGDQGLEFDDNTSINLRFAGQYYDAESGLHYNYFRYYDPSTGRYVTSDPIGLDGGLNTFGYVGGNPTKYVDPLCQYTVHGYVPDPSLSFSENMRLAREFNRSPAGKRVQLLRNLGDAFQKRIDECKTNRKRLQSIFDGWHVWVDPIIDSPDSRNRTEADTNYRNGTTQFNFWFFNGENRSSSFAHEFRHLMKENDSLYGDGKYTGRRLSGNATQHLGELDADKWADGFQAGKCDC